MHIAQTLAVDAILPQSTTKHILYAMVIVNILDEALMGSQQTVPKTRNFFQ